MNNSDVFNSDRISNQDNIYKSDNVVRFSCETMTIFHAFLHLVFRNQTVVFDCLFTRNV